VTQDWKVDANENWIETMDDCVEVTHFADDIDIWECANCSYADRGSVFNVKETAQND
jgi:ribosomal protein L37AE/L43A